MKIPDCDRHNGLHFLQRPIQKLLSNFSFSFFSFSGKKFANMLSPLLSPTTSTKVDSQQYSSTSKLNNYDAAAKGASPNMSRKISRSSEDVSKKGIKNAASNFLEVGGDLMGGGSRKGSLQKDLDMAQQVLEVGAVETAAIVEKGVLNPFSKLTKGLEAVLKGQSEVTQEAVSEQALTSEDVIPSPSKVLISQNTQVANTLLKTKIAEARSQTNVLLI